MDSAVVVFECDSKDVVEEFVSADPYMKNKLVTSYTIREWAVVPLD